MRICNINVDRKAHVGIVTERGVIDASAAGFAYDIDAVIAGAGMERLAELENDASLPAVGDPAYLNIVNRPGKLVCVGLNYRAHAENVDLTMADVPILFSKFADSLVPAESEINLPEWEDSYDYEAELVIVMGKRAWNVSEEDALGYVFGYSCGNDLSCRVPQKRTSQWLIGKAMPGFGPCGPCIVTSGGYDVKAGKNIRSYVNGQLRQNGSTADMISGCARIVSYASHYICLKPGDLIFTGTPSGVALEKDKKLPWLKKGDRVDIEIEGIGRLTNYMV